MQSVKYSINYKEPAGRLELLIRFIWAIPSCIVLAVLEIIGSIAWCIQFLYVLVTGKRHKCLHDWMFKAVAYRAKMGAYLWFLTDERNPIMPED